MANIEQLNILRSGVEAWNDWRKQNHSVKLDLSGIDLKKVNLKGADLASADLSGSKLIGVDFSLSNLYGANLSNCILLGANFQGAHLGEANLSGSILNGADLRNALMPLTNFENSSVISVKFNRWGVYRGMRLDGCYGSQIFIRFAHDQSYIEEFRGQIAARPRIEVKGKFHGLKQCFNFMKTMHSAKNTKFWLIYIPWLAMSDCGRSFFLWFFWSLLIALGFGFIYAVYPDLIEISQRELSALKPYYFSIVTFTTLGFGDVLPKNICAEIILTLEVILGYVMLGGLISIFSTKVARRAA